MDFVLLAGLVSAGLALGRFQTISRLSGRTDFVSASIRRLMRPGTTAFAAVGNAVADFGSAVVHGRTLDSENRRLRALEAAALNYQADVERLQTELEEVRRLAGWAAEGRAKVPAYVIGYFPNESRITLNVGTAQGVKRGMPVATYEGLVGRVETVDAATCQALLITAPTLDSRITALVQRKAPNPSPPGVIRGEGPNALRLELADPTAPIDTGDVVVTSGFSEEIPRGLVIGRVVSVEDDPAFGKRTATVFPRVSLGSIREVLVIK